MKIIILLLFLISITIQQDDCNKLRCAAVIAKCTGECSCVEAECACCFFCAQCAADLWTECCGCFGLCGNDEAEKSLKVMQKYPSHRTIEGFVNSIIPPTDSSCECFVDNSPTLACTISCPEGIPAYCVMCNYDKPTCYCGASPCNGDSYGYCRPGDRNISDTVVRLNEKLKNENEILRYLPGGPGYLDAKNEFDKLVNSHNELNLTNGPSRN